MTTGLEHDVLGRRTEDRQTRIAQVEKRQRKFETAEAAEDWRPREFGDPNAGVLVLSWGSNEGPMREALSLLEEDDVAIRFLSVPYLSPRSDVTSAVEAADRVIVVECNASGQFANLVERDTLTRVERITKFDGVRFTADELADSVREVLADTREVAA